MVFCSECKHFWDYRPNEQKCEHPENIVSRHNWKHKFTVHDRLPKHINKNNNCKWFFRKENK